MKQSPVVGCQRSDLKSTSILSDRESLGIRSKFCFILASLLFIIHYFPSVLYASGISSRAAVAMDASTGRLLYGKNPNLRLLPASTTKLMTAMIALDRLNPSDTVVVSDRAAGVSAVKANLRAGEKVTVETLLDAALIKSANDAAFALAEAVAGTEEKFVDLMNQKAISLGMSDTRFTNSTGLPGHGQFITAYDLARMLRYALRYPVIREIINTKASRVSTEEGRSIFLKNSNRLLWADETILGGKTGYTKEAKHCFVFACEQGNETVIAAVLGARSRETLWKESEELMEKGFVVVNGKEEPTVHFTKADYKTSMQPTLCGSKNSEEKDLPKKKARKKISKRQTRSAKKQRPKENAKIETKGSGAVKG